MSTITRFTRFQGALLAAVFGFAAICPLALGQPAKAERRSQDAKTSPPAWIHPVIADFGGVHPRSDVPVRPDPAVNYRILVDVTSDGRDPTGRFTGLQRLARLVNLMAYAKVPAEHVHIVALLDGQAGMAAIDNAFYRQHFKADNPNLPILHALRKAGVKLMICSQALAEHGLPDSAVSPDVTVTLSGLTDVVVYGRRGYVYMQL